MKDYDKLIKEIKHNPDFILVKCKRKTTVKLTHIPTNKMYSIHPGNRSVGPLKTWIKNLNVEK